MYRKFVEIVKTFVECSRNSLEISTTFLKISRMFIEIARKLFRHFEEFRRNVEEFRKHAEELPRNFVGICLGSAQALRRNIDILQSLQNPSESCKLHTQSFGVLQILSGVAGNDQELLGRQENSWN